MELTQIIQSLESSNPAAAEALTGFQTSSNQALSRISDLEKDLKTAAEKRDKLKLTIKNATGLDEITEESLVGVLTAGDSQADVYKKEITSLQEKLLESAGAVDEVSGKYEKQIFNLQLDRVVNMIGAGTEVHNAHAYNVVIGELANGAQFDGKDIVYKNPDGTTVYADGGSPATVKSQYEALRAKEEFGYLFKEQYIAGGSKQPTGPKTTTGGETIRRSKMSDGDKVTYIAKNGINSYKALPY